LLLLDEEEDEDDEDDDDARNAKPLFRPLSQPRGREEEHLFFFRERAEEE